MALFNVTNFENLMDQLGKGVDMINCLESLSVLDIPLELAEKHQILEKFRKLAPYAPMTSMCEKMLRKLEDMKNENEKKKAKKEATDEKRRMARKRRADENKESESKKMKLGSSELSDQPADRELVARVGKAEATTMNNTAASKPGSQKKVSKKPSLLQKCMKDAMKIKRQFK